jgi:hypothetical protein
MSAKVPSSALTGSEQAPSRNPTQISGGFGARPRGPCLGRFPCLRSRSISSGPRYTRPEELPVSRLSALGSRPRCVNCLPPELINGLKPYICGMARLLRLLPDSASPHEPRSVDPSKIASVSLAAVANQQDGFKELCHRGISKFQWSVGRCREPTRYLYQSKDL